MIRTLSLEQEQIARKVLEIQKLAYRVEAELIGYDDLPPLRDNLQSLQQCGETFYGYFVDEQLAGVISCKRTEQLLDIQRLVVHPAHFRKGIARSLLEHLLLTNRSAAKAIVSTGARNHPARSLYEQHGFSLTAERVVAPGLSLVFYEKQLAQN
ncbi:GNAT family N-acetyltransferase [Brevibacillus fulvus]|uniref:Ribosomal protein S18 acetylase RimI-like enzyme n=1 Tax=Brevibacillus fulvus TaxID=1125967 RepID=A0A938XZX2_9BACL|nr:GNAT family N-acetyltransferase [Brevibacillus fulvus]MBM7590750.1 ribosomal protein S18 acetylase RimI-like enzyme [Brevibacillus fulvus]